MAMNWGELSAIVAIVSLFWMFNPNTFVYILLNKIWARLVRLVAPHKRTCKVLEWIDVPDGYLHVCDCAEVCTCGPAPEWTHTEPATSHEQCFKETLGTVFTRAWRSSSRRSKRVKKPWQLPSDRPYVRIDLATLQAYWLFCQPVSPGGGNGPTSVFKEIDGILTAHLSTAGTAADHPHLTKFEVTRIREGYTPFYRERIPFNETEYIRSPIRGDFDNLKGGWIVGVGLNSLRLARPTNRHNLVHIDKPDGHEVWQYTSMKQAINGVGDRLEALTKQFPQDKNAQAAPVYFKTAVASHSPVSPHILRYFDVSPSQLFTLNHMKRSSAALSAEEWEIVLLAFNRADALTEEEASLFERHMREIVFIAIRGLLFVLRYGLADSFSEVHPITKIPNLREVAGRRHIYLTTCVNNEDD